MDKYVCKICAHIYDPNLGDPDSNTPPGTPFGNLPEDWTCPVCGATKDKYEKLSQDDIEKFTQDGYGKYI